MKSRPRCIADVHTVYGTRTFRNLFLFSAAYVCTGALIVCSEAQIYGLLSPRSDGEAADLSQAPSSLQVRLCARSWSAVLDSSLVG